MSVKISVSNLTQKLSIPLFSILQVSNSSFLKAFWNCQEIQMEHHHHQAAAACVKSSGQSRHFNIYKRQALFWDASKKALFCFLFSGGTCDTHFPPQDAFRNKANQYLYISIKIFIEVLGKKAWYNVCVVCGRLLCVDRVRTF